MLSLFDLRLGLRNALRNALLALIRLSPLRPLTKLLVSHELTWREVNGSETLLSTRTFARLAFEEVT